MGARKILFPLEMSDGEKVHTLKELKEKFEIGRVLEYADSGQLVRWLRDRRADGMAEKIESLDKSSAEYAMDVCEAILGEVNEALTRQIAAAEKEQAEKRERLRMVKEEESEQLRIEKEREAERKRQATLLLNCDGIYVVHENRLKCCRQYSEQEYRGFGVVHEGRDIYYIKPGAAGDFSLHRINSDTGEDRKICGTKAIALCSVRNHRLLYTEEPAQRSYMEIAEMDLDTLAKKSHKIEIPADYRPLYTWFPENSEGFGFSHLHNKEDYPCIDADGTHIYCRMRKERSLHGNAYADIDLGADRMSLLALPALEDHNVLMGYRCGWGAGKQEFVVWEYDHPLVPFSSIHPENPKVRCVYYDMAKKQAKQLKGLEKLLITSQRCPDAACCGDRHIYWMTKKVHTGNTWTFIQEISIMEYCIDSGESMERLHLKSDDFGDAFNYKSAGENNMEIWTDNVYLYLNHSGKPVSWRFSLENWKAEKLVRSGQEYSYIPAALHS